MNDIGNTKGACDSRDNELAVRAAAPCELNVDQVNLTTAGGNTELDQGPCKDHHSPTDVLLSPGDQPRGLDPKLAALVHFINDEISKAINASSPMRAQGCGHDQVNCFLGRTHQMHRIASIGMRHRSRSRQPRTMTILANQWQVGRLLLGGSPTDVSLNAVSAASRPPRRAPLRGRRLQRSVYCREYSRLGSHSAPLATLLLALPRRVSRLW